MRWTAVTPLKPGEDRKSRLADCLSAAERAELADRMAAHVMGSLAAVPAIAHHVVLADRPATVGRWEPDRGAGLNAELGRLNAGLAGPVLVIHADLPFLAPEDILALIAAAERDGAAIAPDCVGSGTNALALTHAAGFGFAFGADSYARHRRALPQAAIVRRDGLAFDIDTPADLAAARARTAWSGYGL